MYEQQEGKEKQARTHSNIRYNLQEFHQQNYMLHLKVLLVEVEAGSSAKAEFLAKLPQWFCQCWTSTIKNTCSMIIMHKKY